MTWNMTFLPSFAIPQIEKRKGRTEEPTSVIGFCDKSQRNGTQMNLTFLAELLSLLTQLPTQIEGRKYAEITFCFRLLQLSWCHELILPLTFIQAWVSFRDWNFLLDWKTSSPSAVGKYRSTGHPIGQMQGKARLVHRPCIFKTSKIFLQYRPGFKAAAAFSSCSFLKNGQLWFLPPNPRPKAWSDQLHDNNPKHSQHSSFEEHLRASLIQVQAWRTQSRLCSPKNGKRVKYHDLGLVAGARCGWKLGREGSHPAKYEDAGFLRPFSVYSWCSLKFIGSIIYKRLKQYEKFNKSY